MLLLPNSQGIWILKPYAGACGRGIRLISKAADSVVPKDKKVIAQRYIRHPFLIEGTKFDLRIYALVTSFDPLRVYLFHDGLARFATAKYSINPSLLKNRFMHLTNYSVNKKNEEFMKNEDADDDGAGSKWSLQALMRYFAQNGIDGEQVMGSIKDVVIKTVIACETEVNSMMGRYARNRQRSSTCGSPCFELFGFDILLDKHLKAWLLEVNVLPSLSSSSPMDKKIKNTLLTDILHLVGLVPYNSKKLEKERDAHTRRRLLGKVSKKPLRQRTARELLDCTLEDLTEADLEVLCDLEDEYARRGNFERIFPTVDTAWYYKFFPVPRYYNTLVDLWLNRWRPAHGVQILNQVLLRRRTGAKGPGSGSTSASSSKTSRSGSVSAAVARREEVHTAGLPPIGALGDDGKTVTSAVIAKREFAAYSAKEDLPRRVPAVAKDERRDIIVPSPDRVASNSPPAPSRPQVQSHEEVKAGEEPDVMPAEFRPRGSTDPSPSPSPSPSSSTSPPSDHRSPPLPSERLPDAADVDDISPVPSEDSSPPLPPPRRKTSLTDTEDDALPDEPPAHRSALDERRQVNLNDVSLSSGSDDGTSSMSKPKARKTRSSRPSTSGSKLRPRSSRASTSTSSTSRVPPGRLHLGQQGGRLFSLRDVPAPSPLAMAGESHSLSQTPRQMPSARSQGRALPLSEAYIAAYDGRHMLSPMTSYTSMKKPAYNFEVAGESLSAASVRGTRGQGPLSGSSVLSSFSTPHATSGSSSRRYNFGQSPQFAPPSRSGPRRGESGGKAMPLAGVALVEPSRYRGAGFALESRHTGTTGLKAAGQSRVGRSAPLSYR